MFGIPIFAISLVMAVVFIASVDVTTNVSEAISTEVLELNINAFAGGMNCQVIEINNDADWSLWTAISFVETSNEDAVDYVFTPFTEELETGLNEVNICFDVTEDSAVGEIVGAITIDRVAQPQ